MPVIANTTKKSLIRLAKLCDARWKGRRWESDLADKLGLTYNQVYGWVKTNKISAQGMEAIEARGYPREKWLIEKSEDESTNMGAIAIPGFTKDFIKLVEEHPVLGKLVIDFGMGNKEGAANTMKDWLKSEGFSLGEELGAEEEELEESVLKRAQNS